jgi:RNA polymerase sigma factor (sigma-70 family)
MANQLSTVIHHLRRALGAPEDAEMSDGQLLQRFVSQQDEAAFSLLLDRYGPMVLGVCRRALSNGADADDAFQATFLVLVRKAGSLRNADRVGNWLYGVACRIARRARIQAARRAPQLAEVPDMATAGPGTSDCQELRPLLDEELRRLPRKYRVPLVLCYLEGKTNEAAAKQLRWPAGTVKTRLARGRDLLRDRLAQRGLVLSATALAGALAPEAVSATVPPALARATLKAAESYVVGSAGVSASVLALAQGAVREAIRAKVQTVLAVLLACVLAGAGAGLAAYAALHGEAPAVTEEVPEPEPTAASSDDGGLAAAVERRVRGWQPASPERRLDEIGWAPDLGTALRLARQHRRPVFLVTHGGEIATARCPASAFNLRAGALSNDRAIALLNRGFVCVHLNTRDYGSEGRASAEEKAELERVRRQAAVPAPEEKNHRVYLLDADGRPIECREACKTTAIDTLVPLLERLVAQDRTPNAGPVVAPTAQSRPPQAAPDALVVHLTARYLERQGDGLVPLQKALGRGANYFMKGLPGENWIVLDAGQAARLLPPTGAARGDSWEINREVSALIFRPMYPPTEDNDLSRNRIDEATLKATIVAVRGNRVRARLEGRLTMKHRFDPVRDDKKFVRAELEGFLDYEPDGMRVRSLQLVSTRATYGKAEFGIAVRSLPR